MLPQPVTQSASSRALSEQSTLRVTVSPGSKAAKTSSSPAAALAVRTRLSSPMGTEPPSPLSSVTTSSSSPPRPMSSPPRTSKRTNQPSPLVRVETVEKYSLKSQAS